VLSYGTHFLSNGPRNPGYFGSNARGIRLFLRNASLYHPSSIRLPRKLPEFTYPKGLLLRRVNNSGDISWHKTESSSAKYSASNIWSLS
jgi:hypothetical protein